MASLGFVEAFARFGAKPVNPMWAVSATAKDGAVVISCWAHLFSKAGADTLEYVDSLSRWGGNVHGTKLLKEHLELAHAENRPIRMVVATAKDVQQLQKVSDASTIEKTFHVRADLVGRLISFDGDQFVIHFTKQ